MATQTATVMYVYGVTAEPTAPQGSGIQGSPIKAITEGSITALVSELPHADEVELGREELNAHATVLEQAMQSGTVLPMRFGVVMENEDAVRQNLLSAHRDILTQQLEEMAGKVEVRLRAVYEEQTVMREVVNENPEVVKLRESIQGKSEDATYYDRIRLGELVAQAVEQKRTYDSAELLHYLESLAIASQVGEPTHERVALNASFLVAQDQLEAFDQAVDEVGRQQQHRMRLKYVGPLPPYSFVELGSAGEA
jgi:hypothetical protein